MRILAAVSASGLLVGGVYASGALDAGEVYDLPLSEVRTRLADMPLPMDALHTAGGSNKAQASIALDETAVRWRVASGAGGSALFTANLHREGPQRTRVTLDYAPAKSGEKYLDRLTGTRFLRGFAETSFAQQVDARLEQRPYDRNAALMKFAEEANRDPEAVKELGATMRGIFTDIAGEVQANTRASEPPPVNPKQAMKDATRPSVVLPPND